MPFAQTVQTSRSFDHSEWDLFVKEFVNGQGEVNYRAAQKKPEHLLNYLEKIKSIPEEEMKDWPREERMALFINAYNAGVVKFVLDHYPLKSIMQIPGVWDNALIQIGTSTLSHTSQGYSLNQIQKGLLLQKFRDEKILFALSYGAKGSSPLQKEAYVGPQLEGQLYRMTRRFVNDDKQNLIDPAQKKVVFSYLFKWYSEEFLLNWGDFPEEEKWKPGERAVLSFFVHYLQDDRRVRFLKEGDYKVKYERFDWRLNED